jgi:hypothetical protein
VAPAPKALRRAVAGRAGDRYPHDRRPEADFRHLSVGIGRQPETPGGARLWALPNPSGRTAAYQRAAARPPTAAKALRPS